MRRLLGWSAVSQTGYGLMAVVALGRSPLAVPALLYFVAAYALATVAAFGVVVELRGQADRARYAGLATAHPWLAAALGVSLLSFVGIPPLAGFTAKVTLFAATIDAGYTWLAVLAVANTVVSVAYYVRVLAPSYFRPAVAPAASSTADSSTDAPRADAPETAALRAQPLPTLGRWAAVAVAVGAAGVVSLGIFGNRPLVAFGVAHVLSR